MVEKVFKTTIDNKTFVLSDKIESGDTVIGFIDRPVYSYWIKDAVAKKVLDNGALLIFKNGISCGRSDRERWFKVIGTLTPL